MNNAASAIGRSFDRSAWDCPTLPRRRTPLKVNRHQARCRRPPGNGDDNPARRSHPATLEDSESPSLDLVHDVATVHGPDQLQAAVQASWSTLFSKRAILPSCIAKTCSKAASRSVPLLLFPLKRPRDHDL